VLSIVMGDLTSSAGLQEALAYFLSGYKAFRDNISKNQKTGIAINPFHVVSADPVSQ